MAAPWYSKDTIALVTGANRGIGFEISRQLAAKGLTVILTARDSTKGQAAVDDLHAKGLKSVVFHQLDATDDQSIQELSSWLQVEYGWIDIFINNAGVAPMKVDYENAKYVFDINYYGAKKVLQSMLLLLRPSAPGARAVNITSRAGLYERLKSESIKKTFRDEANYSEEVADNLAEKYLEDVKSGKVDEEGWLPENKERIYGEAKMCLNLFTAGLARDLSRTQKEGRELFIAGICPGTTDTGIMQQARDQGIETPADFPLKTLEDGADTAVWLALLPRTEWKGKEGKLFAERKEYSFHWNPPF